VDDNGFHLGSRLCAGKIWQDRHCRQHQKRHWFDDSHDAIDGAGALSRRSEPVLSGIGFHPSGEDGGDGAAGIGSKSGANSGGIEVVHTSYSGPNCRRNNSENERSNTNTGSKITVPTYGMATMQQVAQAATHPTIALANAKTIQNN
jgi:hypothetical protein